MASVLKTIGNNLFGIAPNQGDFRSTLKSATQFGFGTGRDARRNRRVGCGRIETNQMGGGARQVNIQLPRDHACSNPGLLGRSIERRQKVAVGRSGLLGKFLRSRSGVTLIEFALVGPLFLLLVFAIFDNGLVLFTQTVLDNATRQAAREIRIGHVTTSGAFQTALCNNLAKLIPCGSLQWKVQSSSVSFSSMTVATASGSNMSSTGFSPGSAQDYVLVQVGYAQPYFMPVFARMAGATGKMLLLSNVAFQSEHYN